MLQVSKLTPEKLLRGGGEVDELKRMVRLGERTEPPNFSKLPERRLTREPAYHPDRTGTV